MKAALAELNHRLDILLRDERSDRESGQTIEAAQKREDIEEISDAIQTLDAVATIRGTFKPAPPAWPVRSDEQFKKNEEFLAKKKPA